MGPCEVAWPGRSVPASGLGSAYRRTCLRPAGAIATGCHCSAAYLEVLPILRLASRTALLRAALLLHGTLHQGLVFLLHGLQLRY